MKTQFRSKLLSVLLVLVMVLALVPVSTLTAFAEQRAERDIVTVESGNSLNMSIDEQGILTWNAVNGATGYQVIVRQNGMQVANWETTNTTLAFVSSMDVIKLDSGNYLVEVGAKGVIGVSASMNYYYTSNVDKLEAPISLQWLGNNAVWNYVDGAVSYKLNVYNSSSGLVVSKTVTQCPVDLSEYNPQDGWTFQVQAQSNGALKDKRNSAFQESPAKGERTREKSQNSGNSLNMSVDESGFLSWDAVNGATGYHIILRKNSMETTAWDTTSTSLLLVTEMDGLKLDSGSYVIEVGAKGVSKSDTMTYYYTSNVDKLEAPVNLQWNGNAATWSAVDGATSYTVILYNFEGRVMTVPVNDTYYDFSGNEPQDGWTFKVQACSNGRLVDERNSLYQESPAKETTYTITCVASEQGTVYIETNKGTQDYAALVSGKATKNTEVTVKAVANSGYEFVEWKLNSPSELGVTCSTDATYSFNATSDIFIYAIFKNEFVVKYHGNGASGGMTGETVNAGGTHTLKECSFYTPDGTKFVGWAIGSPDATPLKQPDEQITVTKDTTIYAVWEDLYFTTQPTDTSGTIGTDIKLPVGINLNVIPDTADKNIVLEVMNGVTWETVAEVSRSEWLSYNGGFTVTQNSTAIKSYQYKIYDGSEWITSDTFTVEFFPIIVTFVDNDHSTTTEPIEVNTVGDKITRPDDPTYAGDTFYGWGWPYWDFENQTVTEDIDLYAQWAGRGYYGDIPNVYAKPGEKARIDLSNVYNNGSYVYIYKYDGAEWKQDVAVSGYTYWDLEASDAEKTERYKIVISHSQNIESNEFTVTWTDTLPTYTVIYGIGEGQGSVDSNFNANKEHGSTFTVSSYETIGAVAPAGKVFDYWSIRTGSAMGEEIAQKQASETITVTADTYVIAMWKNAPTVTVSYYSIGNIVDSDTVAVGTQYTLMNAQGLEVPSGKKFKAWAIGGLGGEQKQPGAEITITEETYIYAVWEDITYTVSFNANGGAGTMLDETEQLGGYVLPECTFTAPTGMQFKCWVEGSVSGTQYDVGDEYDVTANVTFYAVWKNIPVNNFTITATAGANGTISPSGEVTVAEGEDKTFTITANSGYHIKDVKVNGSSVGTAATYTFNDVAANATITVEFEVDTVPHVCNPTLVPEDEPDCTTAGKSAYYHCECGKNYEDAQGNTEIDNLETWGILNALGHNPSTAWSNDGEYHWKECTRCAGQQLERAAHTDTDTNGKCDVCGADVPVAPPSHTHDYGTTWKTDDNNHWKECACGEKSELAAHVDNNGDNKCDTCDYAMPANPPTDDDGGLGTGAIIGIVIGSVAVVGIGGFALFWFVIKKKSFADLIAVFKKKK